MCPNIQYSEVLVLINDGTLDIYVSFSPCPYFRTRPFCLQLKKIYMYISLYQVPTSIWDQCTSTMLENYDNLSCQIWSPQGPLLGRLWSVTTNRMDGNILLISSLPLFLSGGGVITSSPRTSLVYFSVHMPTLTVDHRIDNPELFPFSIFSDDRMLFNNFFRLEVSAADEPVRWRQKGVN